MLQRKALANVLTLLPEDPPFTPACMESSTAMFAVSYMYIHVYDFPTMSQSRQD